jgi:hypothetical protein
VNTKSKFTLIARALLAAVFSAMAPAGAVGEIPIRFQPKKGGGEPIGPRAQAYYELMSEAVTISPDYLADITAIPFGARLDAASPAALFAK